MRKYSKLLLILLGFATQANSQDTLLIDRDYLLQQLSSNNREMHIAEQEFLSARADHRRTNAVFLPQIELSYTAMTTTNPLMAFGSKLNQEILTVQDFNPALLNNPDRTDNFATEIAINQPIINVDGIYQRRAASAKLDAMNKKKQRVKEGIQLEVTKAFMSLQLSYEALEVIEKAEKLSKEGLKLVKDYYEEGMVKKPELLQAELQLKYLQTKQATAIRQIKELSMSISYLIGEPSMERIYQPKSKLEKSAEPIQPTYTFNENRGDISAMYDAAEAYKRMSSASKLSFLPRLNAFGRYQMYDNEIFQADANGYLVGARLSWSIFNGYDNVAKSEKAKIEYLKANAEAEQYKAKSQLELANTTDRLALLEFRISQQETAIEQAREAYQIRKDRFEEGLDKTTDLLAAEYQLFQAEFEEKQILFEYQLTKAYLTFLTL